MINISRLIALSLNKNKITSLIVTANKFVLIGDINENNQLCGVINCTIRFEIKFTFTFTSDDKKSFNGKLKLVSVEHNHYEIHDVKGTLVE